MTPLENLIEAAQETQRFLLNLGTPEALAEAMRLELAIAKAEGVRL